MPEALVSALEGLHLESSSADGIQDEWIDSILEEQRPRKRVKQSEEALKKELELKYLTPSSKFSPEWLNKLQQ